MFLQLLADAERVMQLLHQIGFLRSESIRRLRVDGGEETALHLILLTVNGTDAAFVVDVVEEQTIVHVPFWMTADDSSLLLKLDNGDSLVHLSRQLKVFIIHRVTR